MGHPNVLDPKAFGILELMDSCIWGIIQAHRNAILGGQKYHVGLIRKQVTPWLTFSQTKFVNLKLLGGLSNNKNR